MDLHKYKVTLENGSIEIEADEIIVHDGFIFFVTVTDDGSVDSTVAVFNQVNFIGAVKHD